MNKRGRRVSAAAAPKSDGQRTLTPGQRQLLIDRATAAGRHGPIEAWRTACEGPCGRWVSGIWLTTLDGKRLCVACAAGAGDAEARKYLGLDANGGGDGIF